MKVGIKLFNSDEEVVYEREAIEPGASQSSIVVYQGVYYKFVDIKRVSNSEKVYARFNETDSPYELK